MAMPWARELFDRHIINHINFTTASWFSTQHGPLPLRSLRVRWRRGGMGGRDARPKALAFAGPLRERGLAQGRASQGLLPGAEIQGFVGGPGTKTLAGRGTQLLLRCTQQSPQSAKPRAKIRNQARSQIQSTCLSLFGGSCLLIAVVVASPPHFPTKPLARIEIGSSCARIPFPA